MRKKNSLPEISTLITPGTTQTTGWTTNKGSRYRFKFDEIKEKKFDIASTINLKHKLATVSQKKRNPQPRRMKACSQPRTISRNRRIIKRNQKNGACKRFFSADLKNEIERAEDSNLWASSNSSKLEENKEDNMEELVGKEAFLKYYQKYKKYSIDPKDCKDSASTAFIQECKNLNLNPAPIGLIKRKGNPDVVDVNYLQLGKTYMKALTKSMKHLKVRDVKIQNIKENEKGVIQIIDALKKFCENIKLLNTTLGMDSVRHLCQWMKKQDNIGSLKLKYLNCSNCRLIETTSLCLMRGLKNSQPDLIELDLSRNKISDRSCIVLGEYVKGAYYLTKLDLKWNLISSKGATKLFKGLLVGASCKNLNLSYNCLSKYESLEMIEELSNLINQSLVHLDLSQNHMSASACAKLGELIENNHTLYGLHMQGNNCYVDGFGFIRVDSYQNNFDYSKNVYISPHEFTGHSTSMKYKSEIPMNFMAVTKCWVCEGWSEKTFIIDPHKSIQDIVEPLHIHFSYNNYQPELMISEPDGTYSYRTMCPPGKIDYFFTMDKIATSAKDHFRRKLKVPKMIYDIVQYDEIKTYRLAKINYCIVEQGEVLDKDYLPISTTCVPRPVLMKYEKPEEVKERPPWEFPKSLFASYIQDTAELISECFEYDWSLCNKPKFTMEEEEEIKAVLKKHYWLIKEIFKYQSALGTTSGSSSFAIPLNYYTDFVRNCGVIDGKEINYTESDTLHLSINKRTKMTTLNPGNGLVRFQFLEILMRLGLKRSKKISNKAKRIDRFMNECILKNSKYQKVQEWRWEKYWNEPVDNLYKFHIKLLQEVYNNYSGRFKKPGEQTFMSLVEFENLWEHSGLQNDNFANRDVYVCFNLAMQTRVDELTSDKHLKMSFVEFLEAVARVANYLSIPPPSSKSKFQYLKKADTMNSDNQDEEIEAEGDEEIFLTEEELLNQPLNKKIENILPNLLTNCTKQGFQKKWEWPTKNPKLGLYEEVVHIPQNNTELKQTMAIGINRLIFNKLGFRELIAIKKRRRML
ncbi:unnamed protein product [Moneuplotes crassus]|uniref:Uncharacterized protein n=3 Tax=Euplotes crassus TaxID=5936 RepID=A0AAD1XWD6_EUPCR|nr:unnamed protein product [Moneuplotes crassus]